MFTASEFRRIARDKLRGHWGRSVLVTFIFSLICGISSIYNLAKNMGHMDFDMLFAGNYNDFLAGFAAADTETSLFGSLIALVLSIVVLLFSGALEMGLNKYYIDLVAENRQGTYQGKQHDLIYGAVANDDVYRTITLYMTGVLDKEQTLAALKIRKLFNQLVFATEKSLQYLHFEGRELV